MSSRKQPRGCPWVALVRCSWNDETEEQSWPYISALGIYCETEKGWVSSEWKEGWFWLLTPSEDKRGKVESLRFNLHLSELSEPCMSCHLQSFCSIVTKQLFLWNVNFLPDSNIPGALCFFSVTMTTVCSIPYTLRKCGCLRRWVWMTWVDICALEGGQRRSWSVSYRRLGQHCHVSQENKVTVTGWLWA